MLTPDDFTRLATLADQDPITPEDAAFIKHCAPSNVWFKDNKCIWWYPLDETGYPIQGKCERRTPSIRKAAQPRAMRAIAPLNPNSTTAQQPWVPLGISRATWYQRRASLMVTGPALALLPSWLSPEQGLKLHALFTYLSHTHTLGFNGLWSRVAAALSDSKEGKG